MFDDPDAWHGPAAAPQPLPDDDASLACGLPQDRAARLAARRAFVHTKQLFMRAAGDLDDRKGEWLRSQVRAAEDPSDLWLLRNVLLNALRAQDARHRAMRAELYRGLDLAFPESHRLDQLEALPALPDAWSAWNSGVAARA